MFQPVRLVSALAITALAICACAHAAAGPPRVTTAQGKVAGKLISKGKVQAFLGLP